MGDSTYQSNSAEEREGLYDQPIEKVHILEIVRIEAIDIDFDIND